MISCAEAFLLEILFLMPVHKIPAVCADHHVLLPNLFSLPEYVINSCITSLCYNPSTSISVFIHFHFILPELSPLPPHNTLFISLYMHLSCSPLLCQSSPFSLFLTPSLHQSHLLPRFWVDCSIRLGLCHKEKRERERLPVGLKRGCGNEIL